VIRAIVYAWSILVVSVLAVALPALIVALVLR
jgi:hypothetical protein